MDVDVESGIILQGHFVGSSSSHSAFSAAPRMSLSSAMAGGGLMRYHSAPSSVFAALLDDDFEPTSDDSEFSRLLNDGIGSLSSLVDSHTPHRHVTSRPLSAIAEYGLEASVQDFCLPLPSTNAVQQAAVVMPVCVDGVDYKDSPAAATVSFEPAAVLQSRYLADALSRSVVADKADGMSELAGPCVPVGDDKLSVQNILPAHRSAIANGLPNIKFGKGFSAISSPKRSIALLRQSSSPAELLSQINVDDFIVSKEKRPEECDRKGLVLEHGHGLGSGNETSALHAMQDLAELGQRKRGRVLNNMLLQSLQRSPEDLATVATSNFSPVSTSYSGIVDHLEGPAEESVLCKARAKRGCATHPRSIAERQRRIKISERMKKLQDLVPNLDRQASTAEMLDEVVEYVKLLQRQVQELSLNHPKCVGSCQQGASSPH